MEKRNVWTVKKLRKALKKFDCNAIIVLSIDPEGNGYDTLHSVEAMQWLERWREVRYRELTPEMREMGYGEEDVTTDGQPAVVLWP